MRLRKFYWLVREEFEGVNENLNEKFIFCIVLRKCGD